MLYLKITAPYCITSASYESFLLFRGLRIRIRMHLGWWIRIHVMNQNRVLSYSKKCKMRRPIYFAQCLKGYGFPNMLDPNPQPRVFHCWGVSAIILASGSFSTVQVLPCEIVCSFTENLTFESEVQSFNHSLHLMEKRNCMCEDVVKNSLVSGLDSRSMTKIIKQFAVEK